MSIANRLSRNPVANGGFGDPDLTPKPLRISKREQAGTSVNASLSVCKSQTHGSLQALAPSKRSSIRVNSTQLDLSLQDIAAPTSQWARQSTLLHVHKQRQSEPINVNPVALAAIPKEPIGFGSLDPPARSRDLCSTMGQLGSSSDATRPASTRAFTTGTYRRPDPLSTVHEVKSPLSASSTLRAGQRRAVTNVEAFYKDLDAFKPLPYQGLRKQRTFKNSIMSRMMSGLTHRTHVSHAALRSGNNDSRIPQELSPATSSRACKDMHDLRQSDSSTGTDSYCGSDFHDTLAAFPNPPISVATSPTTAGSSNSRPSIRSKRFRELCRPADAVLMGAELTLTPMYNQASSEEAHSMLVSLDIKGTTSSSSSIRDVWSQQTGLDVVVIVDNSLHTSPTALMANCETARVLASNLNVLTDRLAIICTSITDASGTNSRVVKELSQVRMPRIKTALDGITSSMKKSKANIWVDTVDCAKELLLKSTVPDTYEEPLQDTFGHIFLLTPDPDGLPFQSLAHEKLTFHVISPASALSNQQSSIHCNGWKLRSLSGIETQAVSSKKDLDPTSLSNQLRVLIIQARSGKVLGNLTELVLEVSAGPDCSIEGVIGKVVFVELHPGEIFTALFKLRIFAATVQEYPLSGISTLSSEALPNTEDVLGQLNKMLEIIDAKILTVRLTYKHSLLPAGTTCSVTTECHMKRRFSDPDQKPSPSKLELLQANDCTDLVEKRLAYHMATHGSPRNALTTLHSEFGDRFQFSVCPDYINLLAQELKYQARIIERREIEASAKSPSAVHAASSPSEKRGESPFSAQRYKPKHRAPSDGPKEELFKAEPTVAVLSVKESREQLRTDEARRIWGDLRKMKGPSNEIVRGRSISSQLDEARRRGIRELAVKNKRSVGSDSLRSIFSLKESMGLW